MPRQKGQDVVCFHFRPPADIADAEKEQYIGVDWATVHDDDLFAMGPCGCQIMQTAGGQLFFLNCPIHREPIDVRIKS